MRILGSRASRGKRRNMVWFNPYKKKMEIEKKIERVKNKWRQTFFSQDLRDEDFKWVGDDMSDLPTAESTRFLLSNCNGLRFNKDDNFFLSQIQSYLSTGAHFTALTEINLNVRKPGLKQRIQNVFQQLLCDGYMHLNNGPSVSEEDIQRGGTASMFYGRLSNRHGGTEYDDDGRWIMEKFIGETRNLCVYTVYRVNPGSEANGDTTIWSQLKECLKKRNILNADPRSQTIHDLVVDVKKKMEDNCAVMVVGDFNEKMDSVEGTKALFEDIGLFNVLHHKIGCTPKTHARGKGAIDHIWVNEDILPHVVRAGYAPFFSVTYSDHRCLMMDVEIKKILDEDYMHLACPQSRILKTSIPEKVELYIEKLDFLWSYHKIDEKFAKIETRFRKRKKTKGLVKKLNNLDKLITELMISAENSCSNMGRKPTIPWSPKIHDAIRKIYELNYKRRKALQLHKSSQSVGPQEYYEACANYIKAKAEYRELKKQSVQLREEFIDKRVKLLQEHKREFENKKKEKILKILKHREKQIRQAKKINYVLKRGYKKGLTSILIPGPSAYQENTVDIFDVNVMWKRIQKQNGADIKDWIRVTDRHVMEDLLIGWQRLHFMQANETPLASQQWDRQLSLESEQDKILEGKFVLDQKYPKECQMLFDEMRRNEKVANTVDFQTEFEDFHDFIKRIKEMTGTSPSGRSYSHYKVLLVHEKKKLQLLHRLFSLALEYGVILHRWKKTVTSLIEKDEGRPRIHRMRSIHIIEAELQFVTKIVYANRMMKTAEKHQLVTDEQYGGRKNRQALSVVINKLCYYNISHQTLQKAAFMDDDARACYDRIVPHLASVEARKWGTTYDTAQLTKQLLAAQEFYIRTGHGITKKYYSKDEKSWIQGAGQGLGWSGPLWSCSSDTISKILNKYGTGMCFTDFKKEIKVEKAGDFFVDDTSTGVTENQVPDWSTILKELAKNEQLHAYIMYCEGHKIAFDKCYFYLSGYKLKGIKFVHQTSADMPGELWLREGYGLEPIQIRRLEPSEAHKTLGHYISIDGDNTKQLAQITKLIATWCQRISTSGLSDETKRLAYTGWLVPALKYKLISMTLTEKQWESTQKLLDPNLLHFFGFAKTTARVVLHSSFNLAGLNIHHLYQLQGFEKLKLFLWHLRMQDTTGKLIQISKENTQLETGLSKPFLELKHSKYSYLTTPTWVTSIWEYVEACKVKIKAVDEIFYELPRQGDKFIMDIVTETELPQRRIEIFNKVRLYLQVISLSDLVLVGSKCTIIPAIRKGDRSRTSRWLWPNIEDIPNEWKKIWTDIMESILVPYLQVSPLHEWIGETHQNWMATTDEEINYVHFRDQTWKQEDKSIYVPTAHRNISHKYVADIEEREGKIEVVSSRINRFTKTQEIRKTTYDDTISSLTYWNRRNLGHHLPTEEEVYEMYQCMKKGDLIGVSDGSYKEGSASHSWVFANRKNEERIVQSAATVDGDCNLLNAFRAEAMGVIAQLSIIEILNATYDVSKLSVDLGVDCKSLITKVYTPVEKSIKFIEEPEADTILEIRAMIKRLPCKIYLIHIEGHQDKRLDYELLPFPAQLNCDMDANAKRFLQHHPPSFKPHATYPILPAQKYYLSIKEKIILADPRSVLNDSWIKKKWTRYMGSKLKIPKEQVEEINLRPITAYLKENKFNLNTISKIIHDQINTFKMCKRWKTSPTSLCPLCEVETEDAGHVLYCPHPAIQQVKRQQISLIEGTLRRGGTQPDLMTFILDIAASMMTNYPIKFPNVTVDPIIQRLYHIFKSQGNIGWVNFFRGFITIKMEQLQEDYLRQSGNETPKLSAHRWGKSLAKVLLNYFKSIWKYRCDLVALEKKATLRARIRKEEEERCMKLREKSWQLLSVDRHLLQRDKQFFREAPFVNIYVWKEKLNSALSRSAHLSENKSGDIRRYMISDEVGRSAVTQIVPVQILHRKMKRRRVSSVRKGLGQTTPKRTRVIQCKLNFDGRMLTTPDTSLGIQVK